METEAETTKRILNQLTRARYGYGQTQHRPGHLGEAPRWYVTFLDGADYELVAHAATVWADSKGTLWIDSVHLGCPTSWAEEEYGEKGAIQVMDMHIDYRHLSPDQIQVKLKTLPNLYDRIGTYKRAESDISTETGIPYWM